MFQGKTDKQMNPISSTEIEWTLVRKSLAGPLTSSEQELLDQWLNASPEHRDYYRKISAAEASGVGDRLSDLQMNASASRFMTGMRRYKRARVIRRLSGAAAVLVLAAGMWVLWNVRSLPSREDGLHFVQREKQAPVLVLADGTRLDLLQERERVRGEFGGEVPEGSLSYVDRKPGSAGEIHTLYVPRGGEYLLTLSDGSRVWLNAETEFSYPVAFSGENRVVALKGEAYFEVAKGDCPFIVRSNEVEITVYGTQFNVNSYRDHFVQTVLVSGRVGISSARSLFPEKILRPEELAEVNMQTGTYSIQRVDIGSYIAWKDGYFSFDGETIAQIMEKLSRWYDFEVVYENEEVKGKRFSGHISRSHELTGILEMIQRTALVSFTIEGYTVTIR